MTRAWSGEAQSGSREYTPEDVRAVLAILPRGRAQAMRLRTFVESLTIGARAVRAILSDHDGIHYILAFDGDLFWAAEFAEEGTGHTEVLRSRARREMERVARRERFAATLPRRQEVMAL